jgi:hypothetical protein
MTSNRAGARPQLAYALLLLLAVLMTGAAGCKPPPPGAVAAAQKIVDALVTESKAPCASAGQKAAALRLVTGLQRSADAAAAAGNKPLTEALLNAYNTASQAYLVIENLPPCV